MLNQAWVRFRSWLPRPDGRPSILIAVVIGAVVAVLIYDYAPWRTEAAAGPPTLDVTQTEKHLAEDPIDHAARLELARYYLQWGLAISRSKMPIEEIVTDSELIAYFEERLTEWEKIGQDVSQLRKMLREDFPSFRNLFVKEERALSKGMFERSIMLFRQSRALGAALSPRDLYDLGTAYYQMGPEGYDGASRHLGEAVSRGLVSARALTFLGNVSVARGDLEQGAALYKQALLSAPDDPILSFNLALALKEQGAFDPAIEAFRATLAIYEDKENLVEDELTIILQSRLALGWCLLKKRSHAEAVEQFEALLESKPDLAEGHYWLGAAYEGLGRTDLARAHWQRAARLAPGFRDVEARLRSVDVAVRPSIRPNR
ncbi:MAG: tetratricopeptide repeat protein [Candidatus Hydrogenedentota bacterium]